MLVTMFKVHFSFIIIADDCIRLYNRNTFCMYFCRKVQVLSGNIIYLNKN